MDRINGKIRLSGDYTGHRDADIQFKFRFCDDGVYYYMVEQVGIWRLAHRGRQHVAHDHALDVLRLRSGPLHGLGHDDRAEIRRRERRQRALERPDRGSHRAADDDFFLAHGPGLSLEERRAAPYIGAPYTMGDGPVKPRTTTRGQR